MSERLFKQDVIFLQRLLKSSGLYLGRIDGIWGPMTDSAEAAFENRGLDLADKLGHFDMRSELNLSGLHLKAQAAARVFLGKLIDAGIVARVLSGTRTYEEQNALFRRGRYGNPGPRVTNARGGYSNHNFAIAWDIGIFEDGKYLTTAKPYEEAAAVGLTDELTWGGSWLSFKDRPHYQLATKFRLREIRKRFEKGDAYV